MENEEKNLQSNQNKIGSQVSPVNRFGVPSIDKKESSSIKERLDETRAKNLNSGSVNLDSGLPNNRNYGLDKKPGLQDKNDGLSDNDSSSSSSNSGTSRKSKVTENRTSNSGVSSFGANSVSGDSGASTENGIGDVKSNDNGLTKKNGNSLGLNLGKTLGNTALNVAANNNETVNKAVKTARGVSTSIKVAKGLAKVGKAIAAFFATPVGIVVGFILIIAGLFVIILVIIAMIVNGLGSKFGLTGNEVIEVFNGNCPEGYTEKQCEELRKEYQWAEGMTREEIETLMKKVEKTENGMCKLSFFAAVRNFFGNYNPGASSCEAAHYIKHILEEREGLPGISTVDPGYLVSTLYYAFDTQNYDENGDPYLVPENYDPENPNTVTDLDAVSTLFSTNVYNTKEVETLLDRYIYHEDHDYRKHYHYWIWERPIIGYNADKTPIYGKWDCHEHDEYENYEIDVLQFKLYLRYGDKITSKEILNKYYDDKMVNYTYDLTSQQCKYKVLPKRDMSKYQIKANPATLADDNAKIDGVGYDSGFIFSTFPRYKVEYIPGGSVTYDFKTDKDIEQIIENIDSRQDYTNYVLGYPSTVKTDYGTPSGNIIAGGINPTCSYTVNGVDYSNLKVQLAYGYNALGKGFYEPVEGQELIDFETYITGVTYAEISNGRGNPDAVKAQAIAARSYALAAANNGMARLEQVNGEWILTIPNGTTRQVYCDPNKGCNKGCSVNGVDNNTVFTEGTKPSNVTCSTNSGAISNDSAIRSAVSETAGMILVNSSGNVILTGYRNTNQIEWMNWASQGLDYVEILRKQYGEATIRTNNCSYSVSGDWVSWKQGSSPWGSIVIGGTAPNNTMAAIGCFATSHAMAIAHGAKNILIPDFNPGSFANYLKANGGFSSGGGLRADVALNLAVGEGNWSKKDEFLSGSYESKVAKVQQYISEGYNVILKVQNKGINGKVWDHYVYVYGVEDGDLIMADPATRVKATRVGKQYPNNGITWIKGIKFN